MHMQSGGFSLIELMVTLALVALLTTQGYPFVTSFIGSQKVKAISEELRTGLNLARAEAVKRNDSVWVTALGNSADGNAWQGGWRVWVDQNSNDKYDPGRDTELLERNPLTNNLVISSSESLRSIRYNSTGFADRLNTRAFNDFTSNLLICVGDRASRLVIHRSGRVEQRTLNCPRNARS